MTDQPDLDQVQRDRAPVRRLLDDLEAATTYRPGQRNGRRVVDLVRQIGDFAERAPWAFEAPAP